MLGRPKRTASLQAAIAARRPSDFIATFALLQLPARCCRPSLPPRTPERFSFYRAELLLRAAAVLAYGSRLQQQSILITTTIVSALPHLWPRLASLIPQTRPKLSKAAWSLHGSSQFLT